MRSSFASFHESRIVPLLFRHRVAAGEVLRTHRVPQGHSSPSDDTHRVVEEEEEVNYMRRDLSFLYLGWWISVIISHL
jgi:hypothetical protein